MARQENCFINLKKDKDLVANNDFYNIEFSKN